MKHQAITAALIPRSYAVMQSQGLTEYKKNKTEEDCCEVSYLFETNHCFYRHAKWMLCN